MRTTKAIREYVKSYIQKSYEPKIKECYGDYKKRKYAAWDAICEYESEVNQHIREIIQDCNLSFDDVENFCSFNISGVGLKEEIEIDKAVKELREEQDKKIQEILLSVDFGEIKNRKELDDALRKIFW